MKRSIFYAAVVALAFVACSEKNDNPAPTPVDPPDQPETPEVPDESGIRRDHPRMFFNADTWPEVVARSKSGVAKECLIKLLQEVNLMTDNPVAENTGPLEIEDTVLDDGTILTVEDSSIPYVKEFGKEASKCALAWRFSGNKAYLEKAKKMLSVSVAAYTEATKNRRPVDWYSTGRILALCAYDWIYEALTDDERRAYIVPLMEHVRDVQSEAGLNIPSQPDGGIGQGFYGMASLLWYAGLAGYGDGFDDALAKTLLDKGYEKEMAVLNYRNETAGDDGALSTPALNYAAGIYPYAHFNFFHTYLSATGKNIAEDYPHMALFPNWIWWMWIRDEKNLVRHHGLGDIYHSGNTETKHLLYEHLTQYIHFYKNSNPDIAILAAVLKTRLPKQEFSDTFPFYPFIMDAEYPVTAGDIARVENSPLKARYFETMGHLFMRSSWTTDATYCSLTGGSPMTRDHKHYDEGSFTIYKYDHLALDTGCRGMENDLNLRYYYAQSVAHNVFLVHKPREKIPSYWGPESSNALDKYNYGGMTGKMSDMVAFETGEDYTYAAIDLSKAYGDKVTEAVRQFVYVYPDYFIVYDRVTSSDPSYDKEWLLHMQNEPVVEGRLTRFESLEGRLFCETFLPQGVSIEKVGGEGHEFQVGTRNYAINEKVMQSYVKAAKTAGRGPYTGAWRIEVKAPENEAGVRFLNVLTATSKGTSSPVSASYSADDGHDCVTLSLDGKKISFSFNKSGDVGGTVSVDTQTRPLAQSIQPQAGVLFE